MAMYGDASMKVRMNVRIRLSVKVWLHQGSVPRPLLKQEDALTMLQQDKWERVMLLILKLGRTRAWFSAHCYSLSCWRLCLENSGEELLHADDFVLILETKELLLEKRRKWKEGMEKKGLRVNAGKTNVNGCHVQKKWTSKYYFIIYAMYMPCLPSSIRKSLK